MDEYKNRLEVLKRLLEIQRSSGNWDYDSYMHGMANGMILAYAVMTGDSDPEYLTAPKIYISDIDILDTIKNPAILVSRGENNEIIITNTNTPTADGSSS